MNMLRAIEVRAPSARKSLMYLSPAMAGNVRPNSLGAYIFAAICVAIATLVRVAVFEWVTLTFPTYYVAVLLVSLVGGFFSALFAIALSVIAAWWLFMPPTLEFGAPTTVHIINSAFLYRNVAGYRVDGKRKSPPTGRP